jgi:cytoskeletal protein RodZ
MDKKDENQDALDQPPAEPSLNSLEELSEGNDKDTAASGGEDAGAPKSPKPKQKGIKRLLGFFNVYLLAFIFLLIVGGAVFAVYYLNSQKTPKTPAVAVEDLSEETLNEIANEGQASIGSSDLLLNVKSNAIFAGQILAQGDVNIAGNLQLGKGLSIPALTVSGQSNLGTAQANQLSVANGIIVTGQATFQQGINVTGSSNIATLTSGRITTSSLTLSGTGALELNNHIIVNGPAPSRSMSGAVGSGGSGSVSGSDTAGVVHINTGQGTSAGCMITISFTQRYNSAPNVIISPSSPGAGRTAFYVTSTNASFSICAADPAPTGSVLDFNYFVVE